MAKIMLVEDDNNLREIYGERLIAEGYEIVSAKDGEEALSIAVKERPDLIISDVMMPKISGFDMLDILRQTPETKNTKIIMMTALSQAEDKETANRLGADKYLVKSQVTLEDVARVVQDVLNDSAAPSTSDYATEPTANIQPVAAQTPPAVVPSADINTVSQPAAAQTTAPVPAAPTTAASPQPAPAAPIPPTPPVIDDPSQTTPAAPPVSDTSLVEPSVDPTPIQAATPAEQPTAQDAYSSTPSIEVTNPAQSASVPQPEPAPAANPTPTEEVKLANEPMADTTNSAAINTPEAAIAEPNQTNQDGKTDQPAINPMLGADDVQDGKAALSDDSATVQTKTTDEELTEINQQIEDFVSTQQEAAAHQVAVQEPSQEEMAKAQDEEKKNDEQASAPVVSNNPQPLIDAADEPASTRKKVINPINDPTKMPDINELYEKEMAAEAAETPITNPVAGDDIEVSKSTNDQTKNPMVDQAAPEISMPAPLETADLTKIEGLTTENEQEHNTPETAQLSPSSETPTDPPMATEETNDSSATTTAKPAELPIEPEPEDPTNPNNIAL